MTTLTYQNHPVKITSGPWPHPSGEMVEVQAVDGTAPWTEGKVSPHPTVYTAALLTDLDHWPTAEAEQDPDDYRRDGRLMKLFDRLD